MALNIILVISILWFLWTLIGVIANALGFYKTEDGKTRWSLGTALGVIFTYAVLWQLYMWATAIWGTAFVWGVIVGVFLLVLIPINILMLAAHKK